jgi:hypothetical protein
MAGNTYKKQTSGSLGSLQKCPKCGGGPSPQEFTVDLCNGLGTRIVSSSQGWNGFSGGLQTLPSGYAVGDDVCVGTTNTGARVNGEITNIASIGTVQMYIDFNQQAPGNCLGCLGP